MQDSSDDDEPNGCASYWGPFIPLFGDETHEAVFYSTWHPTITPMVLQGVRLLLAAYMIATYIFIGMTVGIQLQFYTIINYTFLMFSTLLNCVPWLYLRVSGNTPSTKHESRLAHIVVVCTQIAWINALFLDIVFWTLLYPTTKNIDFVQIAVHGLNFLTVALTESILHRMEFRLFYILFGVLFTIVYVFAVAWPYWAVTGQWVYPFLDFEKNGPGMTVAYYLGLVLGYAICGVISVAFSRCFRGPRARRPVRATGNMSHSALEHWEASLSFMSLGSLSDFSNL